MLHPLRSTVTLRLPPCARHDPPVTLRPLRRTCKVAPVMQHPSPVRPAPSGCAPTLHLSYFPRHVAPGMFHLSRCARYVVPVRSAPSCTLRPSSPVRPAPSGCAPTLHLAIFPPTCCAWDAPPVMSHPSRRAGPVARAHLKSAPSRKSHPGELRWPADL